jgi:RNA polymerase sigma-70 factor (ECF subfamily)
MATRQLASRARRRVRGGDEIPKPDVTGQREVVDAFLAALRGGDFEGLLAVLDPELVVRADGGVRPGVPPSEIRGAAIWAKQAVAYGQMARLARLALLDGTVGLVMAPQGKLLRALRFSIVNGKITEIEVIGDAARLAAIDLSIVE